MCMNVRQTNTLFSPSPRRAPQNKSSTASIVHIRSHYVYFMRRRIHTSEHAVECPSWVPQGIWNASYRPWQHSLDWWPSVLVSQFVWYARTLPRYVCDRLGTILCYSKWLLSHDGNYGRVLGYSGTYLSKRRFRRHSSISLAFARPSIHLGGIVYKWCSLCSTTCSYVCSSGDTSVGYSIAALFNGLGACLYE